MYASLYTDRHFYPSTCTVGVPSAGPDYVWLNKKALFTRSRIVSGPLFNGDLSSEPSFLFHRSYKPISFVVYVRIDFIVAL